MGPTAAANLNNLVGHADSNRKLLNYIGYPAGAILIALGLFLMLRSCGFLGGKKDSEEKGFSKRDADYLKAINDDDDKESNYTRSDA